MKRRDPNRQLRPSEIEELENEESAEAGSFNKAPEDQIKGRKIVKASKKFGATVAPSVSSAPTPFLQFDFANVEPTPALEADKVTEEEENLAFEFEGVRPESDFESTMTKLNVKYAQWIDSQLNKHPSLPWTKGANGYIKNAEAVCKKFGKEDKHAIETIAQAKLSAVGEHPKQILKPAASGSITSTGFSFNIPPATSAEPLAKPSKPAVSGSITSTGFSFGVSTTTASSSFQQPAATSTPFTGFTGFKFGTSIAGPSETKQEAPPTVSFGGFNFKPTPVTSETSFFNKPLNIAEAIASSPSSLSTTQPTAVSLNFPKSADTSTPFNFAKPADSITPSTGLFQFSLPTNNTITVPAVEDNKDEEEDAPRDEPAKLGRDETEEIKEETLFEIKARLYKAGEEDGKKVNKDLGIGNVRIMRDRESKKCRIVMRDTIGKVLLNCVMYSGIKFAPTQKSSSVSFMSPSDTQGAPLEACSLKVQKGKLDELMSKLEEAKS